MILQNIKYIKNDKFNSDTNYFISTVDIYNMCKYISNKELEYYINEIKINNKIINVIQITKDIINKGYIFNSIIHKIINYIIYNKNIIDINKAKILFEISFIEKNINDGADEYIQLLKLLNNISNILK